MPLARTPPCRGVPVPGCWCSAGGWWWWNWILGGQPGISLYHIPPRSFELVHCEAVKKKRDRTSTKPPAVSGTLQFLAALSPQHISIPFWIKTRTLCNITGLVRRSLGVLQLAVRPRIAPMVCPGGWGAPMALERCWERGVHLGASSLFLIQKEMEPSYAWPRRATSTCSRGRAFALTRLRIGLLAVGGRSSSTAPVALRAVGTGAANPSVHAATW